ncbi:MAG: transketolase family protein [Candidatus Gastranaerophilales bacterium]|nr:transketolase family protein [Candidatus Gastranaerophilales bacterium]MCM1072883.1 transketolase family protein [Bacteroides sp.]
MLTIDYDTKKSIREAFGKALVELGAKHSDMVVLDSDVSCSTQTKQFAQAYPDRFFNTGIAEQNMIATAAGLALTGKIPFAATFAVFATGRTYDQIRTSVCYQKANVKIIGTHGGITVGEDGATHQALEDISLMRGLPCMTVIVPADCNECAQALEFAAEHKGPVYVRIARNSLPDIYPADYKFNPNKAVILKEGKDLTIISNGDVLAEAYKAAEILESKGISAEVISLPVVKPFDKETIINSIKKTGFAVTVENHSINGGIGSTVCEALAENYPAKVLRIGMNDEFGQSGTPKELLKHYGLDAESIANRIKESV